MTTEPADASAPGLLRRCGWPLLIWALAIAAAVVGTRLLDGSDTAEDAVHVTASGTAQPLDDNPEEASIPMEVEISDRPKGCPKLLDGEQPTRGVTRGRGAFLVPLRAETAVLCRYDGPREGPITFTAARPLSDVPGLIRDLNGLPQATSDSYMCASAGDRRSVQVAVFTRVNGSVQAVVIDCGRADNGRRSAILDEATTRRLDGA